MGQHRRLQTLQVPAGIDAQLVGENLPGPPVGIQRLRLPAGPVQAQHQLRSETFVQRIPARELLQFGDQFGVPSHGEIGLDARAQGAQVQFLQAGRSRPAQMAPR